MTFLSVPPVASPTFAWGVSVADVAVLGTAAADVVVQVPFLPGPGDHLSATSLGWRLGGGSANLACALAAAGHRVELIGPFGSDAMAAALLGELARRGVGTVRSFRVDAPTPRALILLDPSGERTILGLDEGFSTDVYPLTDPPDVGAVDALYVESYLRFPTSIADRSAGTLLVVSPPDLGAGPWPADILVGSERQYPAEWLASPYESTRDVAGSRLQWVIVTRGLAGADAYGPDGSLHVNARPARQVDATGAGDAFAAGLMSALVTGHDMGTAMNLAAAWGAAAVQVLQSIPPAWIEAVDVTWPGSS